LSLPHFACLVGRLSIVFGDVAGLTTLDFKILMFGNPNFAPSRPEHRMPSLLLYNKGPKAFLAKHRQLFG
jgi:hypothetical protein